jgi:hypothetical protein
VAADCAVEELGLIEIRDAKVGFAAGLRGDGLLRQGYISRDLRGKGRLGERG